MIVVTKMEFSDDERQVIAAFMDDGRKIVKKRKATREECRDFLQGAFELRFSGELEWLEGELERYPEQFARGYTLPEAKY